MSKIPNWLTVNQFIEKHPALTHGAVRWDLFNAGKNGLSDAGAIARKGRRVYIDPEKYFSVLMKTK